MFAEERQERIATLIADAGRCTVADLTATLGVTAETVRRDLDLLESMGKLRRVHGGAVSVDASSMSEPSLGERQAQHMGEKARIARAALAYIPRSGNASVLLDAGTTTEGLASLLAQGPSAQAHELLVITNAVPIAGALATNPELEVDLLGGHVRGLTQATVGAAAEAQLEALRPDVAFIGTNGISAGFGLSTPDAQEARIKTAMVRAARRVILLADSSKLGQETLVRFAELKEIDVLITDKEPAPTLAAALAEAEVEVVFA